MFSIIPFLIIKCRTKNSKEKEKSTELNKENNNEKGIQETRTVSMVNLSITNEITELKKKNDKKRTIYNIIFLFILCIMGLFCYFFRWLFELEEFSEAKQSIGIFFEIFDYILLSYFILKQKLYKHHFLSAGIIDVLLIILFIITIPYRKNNKFFLLIVYFLFYSLCFGSYDILGKKYMIKFFITPYFFMFNTRKRINQRISQEKNDLIDSQNLIEMGTEKDEDSEEINNNN